MINISSKTGKRGKEPEQILRKKGHVPRLRQLVETKTHLVQSGTL